MKYYKYCKLYKQKCIPTFCSHMDVNNHLFCQHCELKIEMDIDIKIRENGDISWLKDKYEQLNSKESFNEDDIVLYRELLGHTSQDVDTLED